MVSHGKSEDGPPPLLPGEEIAPGYRVVAHLRRGADLDVYDLWSVDRGCRCVGKTVRPDRLAARGTRARLMREGRLLARLTHPHIVRAYEVQTVPTPLVILETLPGETLAHLIDRHPRGLAAPEVAQLGLQLCAAIGYLHHQNVLHLDIKPSNVVASHGLAKLLDLSLARAPGRSRGGMGTTGYMAPEQIEGGDLGPQTDVWGLGAILYEAATGEPACPLEDDSESATGEWSPCVCEPAPLIPTQRIPVALAMGINGAISRDPGERLTLPGLAERLAAVLDSPPRSPPWP